jgi:transcriptional regulator of acetoin/glycerol metabolism
MAKSTLDATDRKILRFLIKNARTPFLEIARECGISGAAIHQRIKKLEDMELEAITNAMEKCKGNITMAAQRLGVTRQTLYNKGKKYNLFK